MVGKKHFNGNGRNECNKEETWKNGERKKLLAWIPFCHGEIEHEWKKV